MPLKFLWILKWFKAKKWLVFKPKKKGPSCDGWGPEVMDTCVCPFSRVCYSSQWSILICPGLWQKFPSNASSVERIWESRAANTMRMCRGFGRLIVFLDILCRIWCLIISSPCYDHLLPLTNTNEVPTSKAPHFPQNPHRQPKSPLERLPELPVPTEMGCIRSEPDWDLQHDPFQRIGYKTSSF